MKALTPELRESVRLAAEDAVQANPFLATILFRLADNAQADEAEKTATTDGTRLLLNPSWWLGLSRNARGQIVLPHEAWHVALGHHVRRGEREGRKWNKACDLSINPTLRSAPGWEATKGLLPEQFGLPNGWEAERYYSSLPNEGGGKDAGQGGQGSGSGAGGQGKGKGGGEGGEDDGGGIGRVLDAPADQLESGEAEANWRAELQRTATLAGMMAGRAPGLLAEAIRAAQGESKVDWRAALRRFLTRRARSKRTFDRVDRRFGWRADALFPAKGGRGLGKIGFAFDCSRSMWTRVEEAFPEIERILQTFPDTHLELFWFDVRVSQRRTVTLRDLPLKREKRGGGGTSFVEVIRQAADSKLEALVVFTDGVGTFPPAAPKGMSVLWVLISQFAETPFGEKVRMR